jgi:hypothetical protein
MATIKGKKRACSLKQDKDGYYVATHRARSKSYKSPDKIPEKAIKFVESTG